nr:NAD(P)/FAD-dependent oxidoreductase [Chryseobacterium sp.]
SDIAESLGCELTEMGHIKIDQFQKTNVVGLLACGDNSSPMRSIANAVYTGNLVGAMVNAELVGERF